MVIFMAVADVPVPVSPMPTESPMPAYRVDAFRASVAARLRDGATPALLIREQHALMGALQDNSLLQKMAQEFQKEINLQQPNPAYATSVDEATQDIAGILQNRLRDAGHFVALLSSPIFLKQVDALLQQPAPANMPYSLPAVKSEEVVRRLVQSQDPDGAEPRVHVMGSAQGQRVLHQALANLFKPQGELRAALLHSLATQWPEATGAELETLAGSWLKARHDAAHEVAKGLAPDGPLYQEAMQRVTPTVNAQPVPMVVHFDYQQPIAATPALTMDSF